MLSLPWWLSLLIIAGLVILFGELIAWLLYTFFLNTCRLRKSLVFRDKCGGTCVTPGQVCVAGATRPYGPWGIFGTQDAACSCGAPGTGVAGGTGAPAIAGPGTPPPGPGPVAPPPVRPPRGDPESLGH